MTKKERVLELFHNDLNCAQSIIYVYGEAFGIGGDVANSIAVGFGSGFGRTQAPPVKAPARGDFRCCNGVRCKKL